LLFLLSLSLSLFRGRSDRKRIVDVLDVIRGFWILVVLLHEEVGVFVCQGCIIHASAVDKNKLPRKRDATNVHALLVPVLIIVILVLIIVSSMRNVYWRRSQRVERSDSPSENYRWRECDKDF
jgi:hypothetical protein